MTTTKGTTMTITAGERQRIQLCRATSPEMTVRELCHYYMINRDHATEVLGENPLIVSTNGPTRKRRLDHHTEGQRYAVAHTYEETTVNQLATALGVSEPTARKIIDARPDCYRKLRRGVWECRNPQLDRQHEKGK